MDKETLELFKKEGELRKSQNEINHQLLDASVELGKTVGNLLQRIIQLEKNQMTGKFEDHN